MTKRTALRVFLAMAAVLPVAGVGGWRWVASGPAPAALPVQTAEVVRADLASRESIPGTLGHIEEWELVHPGPAGVLTAFASPGTPIRRGQTVYEVDGVPVVLLYGARPVWRDFSSGMPRGEDVRQLERNLTALGFARHTTDTAFTSATAVSIRAWQHHRRVAITGRLPLGSVVFAPDAVRVVEALVPLGGRVGPGPVLRVSSVTRGVTAALPSTRIGPVRVGSEVEVTVPGGRRIIGVVTGIGGTGPANPGADVTRVPMTVELRDPAPDLDQVPVQVAITVTERRGVLAVPVTALIAAPGGGYEVIVVDGRSRRVAVRPGLVDERAGLVEVAGDGLAAGMRVEVPTP